MSLGLVKVCACVRCDLFVVRGRGAAAGGSCRITCRWLRWFAVPVLVLFVSSSAAADLFNLTSCSWPSSPNSGSVWAAAKACRTSFKVRSSNPSERVLPINFESGGQSEQ